MHDMKKDPFNAEFKIRYKGDPRFLCPSKVWVVKGNTKGLIEEIERWFRSK